MFFVLMGTVVIAGIVGYVSEKTGFTHNGYLQSIIICVGGAFLFLLCPGDVRDQFRLAGAECDSILGRGADHRADALSQVAELKGDGTWVFCGC